MTELGRVRSFFWEGGGMGLQRGGSSVKVSIRRGRRAIPIMSYLRGGSHIFSRFLLRIFVMLLSIFLFTG